MFPGMLILSGQTDLLLPMTGEHRLTITFGKVFQGLTTPCPAGFRLPTAAELAVEKLSWSSNDSVGAFGSPLKLVLARSRDRSSGRIYGGASPSGVYWSSTAYVNQNDHSHALHFTGNSAGIIASQRANGFSIRCLKD